MKSGGVLTARKVVNVSVSTGQWAKIKAFAAFDRVRIPVLLDEVLMSYILRRESGEKEARARV